MSSSLALSCSEGSHSDSNTTSSSQSGCELLVPPCAMCTVLQRCRTNCVPTKLEWAQIDALVDDARCNITQIKREICQKNQTRAELEMNQDDLQRFIDNAQSLTAPIRLLPPELLNEIFEMTCISDHSESLSTTDPQTLSKYGASMTQTLDLSQVCAFWRAVVLSRPALWAVLDIDLSRVSTIEMIELASYYIQSSKPRLLQLSISMWDERLSARAYDLFRRLLAESERWHKVYIDATERAVPMLSSMCTEQTRISCFPMLTNLSWCWEPADSDDDGDCSLDLLCLSEFPKLVVCNITSFSPAYLDSIRMPNLMQLDLQFHFEHHPLAALLFLLPNLRQCRIGGLVQVEHPYDLRALTDLTPHCNLRQLELNSRCFLSRERFFHSLSLPRLETLSLDCFTARAAVPLSSTGRLLMLDSSHLNLKHLALKYLDEGTIIQILDRVPFLITLSLTNIYGLSSALFKRLTLTSEVNKQMTNLVPRLGSLNIVQGWRKSNAKGAWFLQPDSHMLDTLCNMVESRCRSLSSSVRESRLESLSLSTGCYTSASLASLPSGHRLREQLEPLVEAGLSLELITKTS